MRTIVILGMLVLAAGPAAAQTAPAAECADFAARLEACVPYTCTFTHPFTGQPMERRIIGLKGDRCEYQEQMPNGGLMTCSYTEETRRDVAAFFQMTMEAQSVEGRAQVGSGGATTSTKVDGRQVRNPLDEALRSGACRVSGYGSSRPGATAEPIRAGAPGSQPKGKTGAVFLGSSAGTLTFGGKPATLSHAYAFAAGADAGGSPTSVLIVLSEGPLTAREARTPAALEAAMRARRLRAVTAVVDPSSKAVTSMYVYDPAHRYAVFVAPSNRRLDVVPATSGASAGRLATLRPGAFSGVTYEVDGEFHAAIQR